MSLNLSSQPFVNSRPVRRLVSVLWCLGLLLVAANLFVYARHFSGQQERLDRLAALTEREAGERDRLAELQRELAGFDLEWQNRQVNFLNQRIAERVFPWSRLFDRLTEVLPRDIRLVRLRPQIESLAGAIGGPEESVRLEIRGESRNEEAILELVGQLFEHAAFRNPNLSAEDRRARSSITEFSLSTTYLPARATTQLAAGEASAGDDGEPAEEAGDGGEDEEVEQDGAAEEAADGGEDEEAGDGEDEDGEEDGEDEDGEEEAEE